MKTQMTITLDIDIKEQFKEIARKMGSNASTLINMLVANVVNTGEAFFTVKQGLDVEISGIKGSEEFIGSSLHRKGRKLLSSIK